MSKYYNLSDFLEVVNNIGDVDTIYSPIFFKIVTDKDRKSLQYLIESYPCIRIINSIRNQVNELIKLRNPSKELDGNQIESIVNKFFSDRDELSYGVWIFYPWENFLIHLLEEEDFVEVRTSRNQFKITKEEQEVFSKKRVGVIGLSVGQSIAVTMAIERICGELRLADFDKIELSNLNRIKTSIKNLSLNKSIVAAREISLIDPYIKVICFCDGINENNIDEFLLGNNSKLDVLIEECDSVDIKILSRIKAKLYGIPVVMDTNDRGMIDIERFDLNKDYPILHGLIDNLDYKSISKLTIKEKIKILGPIAGIENMSPRMKYSLSQIGKTITTWPQLASSVMLGGAIVTDTVRRIFNGEFKNSGRYYVDVESIVK
ncbi:ThiF family adenylyltransferase [Thermoflavifilum thermophilum]|uniref:ThiF family protein n=1 Tax=Thermoflavifilum thermophilum TaxID=1393122 RepID=A0A1I7NE42_9BACT|nr:ThiF family adenylyltransferase [Thermoflavifilum thermophilum]SFV32934.1 ThiF family protein [Thermoflavifilum thermophilum]